MTPNIAVAVGGKVTATFNAVCHAVAYTLYRSATGANAWTKVASMTRGATDATDDGTDPVELTLTDSVAAGTAGTPPASNGAALAPYAQNPNFATAMTAAGIAFDASDASKAYPSNPADLNSASDPGGRHVLRGRRPGRARATRATSTTTPPSRPSSSTSTTGSTRRRRAAATARRSPA